MTSLRDIFKKSASKSKDVSKSINKGAKEVLDFDLSKLRFIFHWFFVIFFSFWALIYSAHVFNSYTFQPFGRCCDYFDNTPPKEYVDIYISSIISLHYIFKIYFIYFLSVVLFFLIRAIKNKKLNEANNKQIVGFFLLNIFVSILSHFTVYFIHGYTFQEAFKYGLF